MMTQQRKRKRRCQYECKDHIFSVQTLKTNSSKYDIKLQFCPKYQRQPLPPEHTFPQFNNDFKFYTSAFILGVDKRQLTKNQQQELMDHQKQIRDSLEKHNQLVFPRPNSKHSLCSVCKEHYKNYYFHIASDQHRQRINLSPYNNHIKQLCMLYVDLWEGAEQRADEQAQKRAIQQEQRRQKMAQASLLEPQEDSNMLLDCERGDNAQQVRQYEEYIAKPAHGRRPSSKSFLNNDDTVPMYGRPPKRSAPDSRSSYEPAMRKRYTAGQFNPYHTARERKQRQYERQRDKMMKGTQYQHFKKVFVARPVEDQDVFIIMQPVKTMLGNDDLALKKIQPQKNIKKNVQQLPIKPVTPPPPLQQSQNQSLSSQSQKQEKQMIEEKIIEKYERQKASIEEGELSPSEREDDNSESEIDQKQKKRGYSPKKQEVLNPKPMQRTDWGKMDPRTLPAYYHYPPMPMPTSHMTPSSNPSGPETLKGPNTSHPVPQHYKNMPESYKNMAPYYYPYVYPMYDPHYPRQNEKGYEYGASGKQKQKGSLNGKPYEYPMPYPPWSYSPYMPPPIQPHSGSAHPQQGAPGNNDHPPTTPGKGSSSTNPNSPYVGSTSININFPMYMCPPHPNMPNMSYPMPSSRYPMHPMMNPYMGYQYGPYVNPQDRNGRQGEYQPGQPHPHPQPNSQGHPQQNPQSNPQYPHNYPPGTIPPHHHPHLNNSLPHNPNLSTSRPNQSNSSVPPPPHHPPPYYYPQYPPYQNPTMSHQQQKGQLNKDK